MQSLEKMFSPYESANLKLIQAFQYTSIFPCTRISFNYSKRSELLQYKRRRMQVLRQITSFSIVLVPWYLNI